MRRSGRRTRTERHVGNPVGRPGTSAPTAAAPAPAGTSSLRPAFLAIIVVWALLFAPQLFARRGFVLGDAADLRAYAEFSAAQWHAHHVRTHWTPYLFGGLPTTSSLADFRPQFLPDPLLDLWDAVHRLPLWPPLAIPLLVHLAGMLACARLARDLWGARAAAAAWAGLAWGLMPNLIVPFAFGHDPQLMAVSLVPVTLLAVRRVVASERPLGATLALALAIAFDLLAQYPQIVLFVAPLATAFALATAVTMRRPGRLGWIVGTAALGAAMSAASWWPALLYNRLSVRGIRGGIGLAEVAQYSLAPRELATLAWPWAAGFGGGTYWGGMRATDFPQYLGTAAVALAALGLRPAAPGRRSDAGFFAAVAAIAAVVALGTNLGTIYRFLHEHAPLWSNFRLPVNALIVTQLGVALLSARGLELALREAGAGGILRSLSVRAMLAGALALLLGALAIVAGGRGGGYATSARAARPEMPEERVQELVARASADLAVRGLTVAAVPALIAVSAAAPAAAVPLVAATLAADLGPIDVPFLRRANGDLGVFAERTPPPIARLAAADTLRRAMALRRDLFFSNDWIRWRVPSMAGFHPAVPIGWADLRRTGLLGHYPMMRALAIGYVSGEVRGVSDTALYERIAASPPDDPVWRVRGALPRAFAVRRVVPATGDEEELAMLAAPDFDPSIVAVTSERAAQADYPGSAACALRWRESGTDRLVLETEAPAAAFVVIADTWFPGWRARVDDTDAAIVRVDHMLRGIAVPAGRHHLTLTYEPEGWRASTRVTWVAWMLWLAGGVLALWMARRPRSATAAAG